MSEGEIIYMHFHDGGGDPTDDPDHPSENEQWYDKEVAPTLLRLAQECEKKGIAFLTQVEYEPGGTSEICVLPESSGFKARSTYIAIKSHGNVDALIKNLYRHAQDTNQVDVSIYFTWMGRGT